MANVWGNLSDTDRQALRSSLRSLSDTELAERFERRDGKVVFRAIRKTNRASAGDLDLEVAESGIGAPRAEYEIAEITMIPPEQFDYTPKITEADRAAAKPIDEKVAAFKSYYSRGSAKTEEGVSGDLPTVVDHRPTQSPVKDQGGRGTCVAHASMGVLEAYAHINDDLSEQYTHYKFNVFEKKPQNKDEGIKTTNAAIYLARNDGRTCLESEWPYIPDQATINQMVAAGTYAPPAAAVKDQNFGVAAYKIIEDKGLAGESIKNTLYLEALLSLGYNIVVGVWASWDDKDNNGILEPVLDSHGDPVGQAGHAMLIVGYDRNQQYFIIKNSWRNTWGHAGYGYFHYNFIRTCAKYGYVLDAVVPTAPSVPIPAKLVSAPFGTAKIGRAALRAVVAFFKTSKGRFAVAEVYAGDNLYLRNLRVYNPDGSVHLTKDSLVIRGTYLCDLDTGLETSNDADFWWEAVSPGVNYLVPRNNAGVWIAYDLAALTPAKIDAVNLHDSPIAYSQLRYAVVVGKTTAGRRFKLLAHAKPGNRLELSYVEVYSADGSRYRYGTELAVPSSWTYNLDTLQQGGGNDADLWWHVISDRVGFLEVTSTAHDQMIWCL